MTRRGGPSDRAERKQTAAVEQATGSFYCSSSDHLAAGTPVILRGRKICQSCADKRAQRIKGKDRG